MHHLNWTQMVKLILVNSKSKLVDAVSFGPQEKDISYGRYPDGTGEFYKLAPTYGNANASPLN